MGQSAVLEIGNGRMRHLSAVFFLSTFVVSSISIFPDVFAQESETVLQVSGSARFEESDYAGSCKSAVAAARWNAAKLVLSDYIKTSTLAQKSQNIHACFDHRVFSLWLLGRTHLRITRWSLQYLTPGRHPRGTFWLLRSLPSHLLLCQAVCNDPSYTTRLDSNTPTPLTTNTPNLLPYNKKHSNCSICSQKPNTAFGV